MCTVCTEYAMCTECVLCLVEFYQIYYNGCGIEEWPWVLKHHRGPLYRREDSFMVTEIKIVSVVGLVVTREGLGARRCFLHVRVLLVVRPIEHHAMTAIPVCLSHTVRVLSPAPRDRRVVPCCVIHI